MFNIIIALIVVGVVFAHLLMTIQSIQEIHSLEEEIRDQDEIIEELKTRLELQVAHDGFETFPIPAPRD